MKRNPGVISIKVSKCEIFDLEPLWVGDFETEIINCKFYRFGLDFQIFFGENYVKAFAEYALKKISP